MKTEDFLKLYAKASGWESDVTVDDDLVPEYPCVKYHFGDKSVLSVCPEFEEKAGELFSGMSLEEALSHFFDLGEVELLRERVLGFYADTPMDGEDLPDVTDGDALEEMLSAMPYEDRARGEVSADDDFSCCIWQSGKIIGAAGAVYDGVLADISVCVHPDFRGKGLGKRLVAALCRKIREKGIVSVYRVEEHNVPSLKVAEDLRMTLGFTMEGAQVVDPRL